MRKQVIGRLAIVVIMAIASGPPYAQQGKPDPTTEPEAMAALQKMGGYLRSLKAFQVEAVTSDEDVLEDGQKVQFDSVINLVASRVCGNTWYQPQLAGGSTTYVIVNPPGY